ncbi:hypothetical protein pb186bvf_000474 [Paramecium bursaria]
MTQQMSQQSSFILDYWCEYYNTAPKQVVDDDDDVHNMILLIHQVLSNNPLLYDSQNFPTYVEVQMNIQAFFQTLNQDDLMNVFIDEPTKFISSISLALHGIKHKKIVLRIYNIPESEQLMSAQVGKYVCTVGTIIQTGPPKLQLLKAMYECIPCESTRWAQADEKGAFQPLQNCDNCSKPFTLNRNKSEIVLYQKLKLMDSKGMQITIEFRQNLVSSFMSGDIIKIHGILMALQDDPKSALYSKYIKVYHAQSAFHVDQSDRFSKQEYKQMLEMQKNGELFHALIQNFCPTIYGHEVVKAGLLMSIVGGHTGNRPNSHCLLVGDPGQGKSQLLKFVQLVAPNAIYISGTATTQSGLTCTVNRRDNETIVDAGALVMADGGVCCLDEFDKMNGQHNALLEAMEQQTVSLAKSAIMCQFHARTTIIATANPVSGCFQRNKSVVENIKIPTTILSRFDLIFLLIDIPDPERDKKLSEHIMRLHNQKQSKIEYQTQIRSHEFKNLQDRIRLGCKTEFQISIPFMRKILKFVKTQKPKQTVGANKMIQDYYLRIRSQALSTAIPITTRQLESLIRLSQARARLMMKPEVTQEDAQFAIEIFEESRFDCFQVHVARYGRNNQNLNFSNVSTLSKPKQTQVFLEELHQRTLERQSQDITIDDIKEVAKKINLSVGDLGDFIEKLNNETLLIKKGSQLYKLNYKTF